MLPGQSRDLAARLATISSNRPEQIRAQLVAALRDTISSDFGAFFTCATNERHERYFTGVVTNGDPEIRAVYARHADARVMDAPWLPPHLHADATNTFVRTRTFYRDDYLARFDVQKTVAVPLQIGDELRAVFFDGPRFLGWIGINRRGQSERFRATEERALRRASEQIKSVLAAADALESKNLEGGVYAVCTPDGVIEHASTSFKRWLTAERTQYLRQRVQALDSAGPCGAGPEFHDGAEVHLVRMDGTANVGYLATLTGVAHLRLCPRDWLTPRQLEIAEHAAAGATASEIAQALDISPHTVKFHLKNIYQRLQVASRLELAAILAS